MQRRGGKGIINLKVSDKTGRVVGARSVVGGQEVIFISEQGKLIRTPVDGVSMIGRATQGVRVMDLGSDDRLVALAKVAEGEAADEEITDPEAEIEAAEKMASEPDEPVN